MKSNTTIIPYHRKNVKCCEHFLGKNSAKIHFFASHASALISYNVFHRIFLKKTVYVQLKSALKLGRYASYILFAVLDLQKSYVFLDLVLVQGIPKLEY